MKKRESLPVIFVVDDWGISAIFPTLPGTSASDFTSYAKNEGHSTATKGWYRETKVVKDKEILKPLLNELENIYNDYNLKVVYKFLPSYDRIRAQEYRMSTKGSVEGLSDEKLPTGKLQGDNLTIGVSPAKKPKTVPKTKEVNTGNSSTESTEQQNTPDTETDSVPDIVVPTSSNSSEVATVSQMRYNKFPALKLPAKYKSLIGKVPVNFRMLLWGAPGHGKSSLALMLANDIGRTVKVLFVSAEESLKSATLTNRIKRFKTNSRNLIFNDSNNIETIERIINTYSPKFVVIDSVNVIKGKVEAVLQLMQKYSDTGFIIIAQATKDHKKYSGISALAHAVDIVVNVNDGQAEAQKNRYSALGSMTVKGIIT
jgi:hypothetical protein